jgi:histone H3/H4
MADLIVQSAIKEQLTDHNVSSDFYDALDDKMKDLLADAAQRAEDNDRKTVQPRNL